MPDRALSSSIKMINLLSEKAFIVGNSSYVFNTLTGKYVQKSINNMYIYR